MSEHAAQPVASAGRSARAIVLFLGVCAVFLAGDLAIKYLTFQNLTQPPTQLDAENPEQTFIPHHEPVPVIRGLLSLKLTTNTGAVFGLGEGGRWIFILISFLAIAVIIRLFWRSQPHAWMFHIGLALILAGALGNLYDRIRYAQVRDMFWLFPETRIWPYIFNLADVALVLGVCLVVLILWQRETHPQNDEADAR